MFSSDRLGNQDLWLLSLEDGTLQVLADDPTPDEQPRFSPDGNWIAFTRVPSVGRVRVGLLEERFGSLEAAWGASAGELRAAGLDPHVVSAITEVRPQIDPHEELERVQAAGISVLTWHDPPYPRLLRELDDPPPVLYVQG